MKELVQCVNCKGLFFKKMIMDECPHCESKRHYKIDHFSEAVQDIVRDEIQKNKEIKKDPSEIKVEIIKMMDEGIRQIKYNDIILTKRHGYFKRPMRILIEKNGEKLFANARIINYDTGGIIEIQIGNTLFQGETQQYYTNEEFKKMKHKPVGKKEDKIFKINGVVGYKNVLESLLNATKDTFDLEKLSSLLNVYYTTVKGYELGKYVTKNYAKQYIRYMLQNNIIIGTGDETYRKMRKDCVREKTDKIYEVLINCEKPYMTLNEIKKATGLGTSTVSKYVDVLEAMKKIEVFQKKGSRLRYMQTIKKEEFPIVDETRENKNEKITNKKRKDVNIVRM
jgi:predicted  nucleic acid-binding Zn-ribbon protein